MRYIYLINTTLTIHFIKKAHQIDDLVQNQRMWHSRSRHKIEIKTAKSSKNENGIFENSKFGKRKQRNAKIMIGVGGKLRKKF